MVERNAGEVEFILEYAKKSLVELAVDQILGLATAEPMAEPFRTVALEKGWLGKRDGALTSKGFFAAAAMLKR